MFKSKNQQCNTKDVKVYFLTNCFKVNLLEAKKMLRNPTNVSNVVQCSKLEPQPGKWYICINCNQTEFTSDGIEWQVTGTNVLPNDKNPIVHVEYFASENVHKSVFKLVEKNRYNAILINYVESSHLNITNSPKIETEIKKPKSFVSKKRSMKSIMKDRLKIFKNLSNEEIMDNQSTIELIK